MFEVQTDIYSPRRISFAEKGAREKSRIGCELTTNGAALSLLIEQLSFKDYGYAIESGVCRLYAP